MLPNDYAYELPLDYCEFHYCAKDENGNYITEIYDDEDDYNDNNKTYEDYLENENKEEQDFWWEE